MLYYSTFHKCRQIQLPVTRNNVSQQRYGPTHSLFPFARVSEDFKKPSTSGSHSTEAVMSPYNIKRYNIYVYIFHLFTLLIIFYAYLYYILDLSLIIVITKIVHKYAEVTHQ